MKRREVAIFMLWSLNICLAQERNVPCVQTPLDEAHVCQCPYGETVVKIESWDNNKANDRSWTHTCSTQRDYDIMVQCSEMITDWTTLDQPFNVTLSNGDPACGAMGKLGFFTGWESIHDNGKEDRKFRFYYSVPSYWEIDPQSCYTQVANAYDQDMAFSVPDGEVIARIASVHDNHYEDRQWRFTLCKIYRTCTVISAITYNENSKTIQEEMLSDDQQSTSNIDDQSSIQLTYTIQRSFTQLLGESQSFQVSSESSISHESQVTVRLGLPIPFLELIVDASYQVGYQRTTTTSWSWETHKEFTEENGKELEYQYECSPCTRCTVSIQAAKVTLVIPYTFSLTSSNSDATCSETGTFHRTQVQTSLVKKVEPIETCVQQGTINQASMQEHCVFFITLAYFVLY